MSKKLSYQGHEIDEDEFCYYPFTQLLLQPTGTVSPCCWNQGINLGQIKDKNLTEIWNDEPIQALRREFLEGRPKMCDTQMRHIRCHRWSRRDDSDTVKLQEIQSARPARLDVRLNGKCNLACVMCEVWTQPNGVYDRSEFWERGPTEIFPNLKEIDVLGGEPFVQADTYRLIDEVTKVNPSCTWAFVTNGHYKFNTPIQSRLEKIAIRWMQISLDSIDPATYRKIRVHGELSRTLQTLMDLKAFHLKRARQGRSFKFIVSMCVQKLNWREVGSFLEFAQSHEVTPVLQFAYQPDSECLLSLPDANRREILQWMEALPYSEHLDSVLFPLRDSLKNDAPASLESHPIG